jgi:opacity protein-like surface antigen
MKIKFYGRAFVSLIIISLFILPTFTHAQKQKIRVVVENANIRMQPNMESEVIENPPVGSVFEVEKKIGEWYEIRFPSKVGLMITGYIHEMLVELEEEAPKVEKKVAPPPPPRREAVQPPPPPPPIARRAEEFKRFSVFISGNIPIYSQSVTTDWSDSWSFQYLNRIDEGGTVTLDNKSSIPGFGGGFVVMFTENIGIEGRIDYMSGKVENSADFSVEWTWSAAGGGGSYSDALTYDVEEGSLSLMPISINLHARFPMNSNIVPYISGGLSIFTGKFSASTDMGDAGSWYYTIWPYWYQYIDWFTYQYTIDESITGAGGNLGAGLAIQVSPNISINMEARYFIGPTKSFEWVLERKTYESLEFGFEASDDFLDYAEELMNTVPVEVKTSFPSFNIGIRIEF